MNQPCYLFLPKFEERLMPRWPLGPTGARFDLRGASRSGPGLVPVVSRTELQHPAGRFPDGLDLEKIYNANVNGVGQDKTWSPWGTYDQNGNVVEIIDTLAWQPPGYNFLRNWHCYHGGVADAPAYQLEVSGFGYFRADTAFSRAYPWLGFRVGVIANL